MGLFGFGKKRKQTPVGEWTQPWSFELHVRAQVAARKAEQKTATFEKDGKIYRVVYTPDNNNNHSCSIHKIEEVTNGGQ